jgi:tRNA threonylcarbamoyladenosine biosynthesis protein TsaB
MAGVELVELVGVVRRDAACGRSGVVIAAEYNIAPMIILALDTATRGGSAALLADASCDARAGDAARTHGERLPAELLSLLSSHGIGVRDVDRFAIVAGPGSFTGLRVGMASMQGLALVTDRLVAPIPTLDAMAEAWRLQAAGYGLRAAEPQNLRTPESQNRLVIAALDGQRGDIFFSAWRASGDRPVEEWDLLISPNVGEPADLVRHVVDARASNDEGALIIGTGLERHAAALAPLDLPIVTPSMTLAEAAARTAARRPDLAVRPHALRPIYIRRPDAVLARERAGRARQP